MGTKKKKEGDDENKQVMFARADSFARSRNPNKQLCSTHAQNTNKTKGEKRCKGKESVRHTKKGAVTQEMKKEKEKKNNFSMLFFIKKSSE